jgi:hypothetical protein
MKFAPLLFATISLCSCWKVRNNYVGEPIPQQIVWGSRPIYATETTAKLIAYIPKKQPLQQAGNIYAFRNYIFQIDVGRGIHIIDNSVPAKADRIGFITMNGCEQISIKGNYLYTNSYADLVTLDMADPMNLKVVSRIPGAFPEFAFNYPLIQPVESGYYTCPRTDSIVVGWVKDSINASCYKN